MTDDDDDLFAVRPAKPARRPAKRTISETTGVPQPNPKIEAICQPAPVPVVSAEMVRQPSGLVASFACVCGGQDEVREPAPLTVSCWSCKRTMKRWNPRYDTPYVSARELTDAERQGMSSGSG